MGTWAIGSLENDTAMDWLAVLVKSPDVSLIQTALNRITQPVEGFPQIDDEFKAIAAAEVIACWLGNPPPQPKRASLVDWSRQHLAITPEMVTLARQALSIIKAHWSHKDAWGIKDADAKTEWLACITDLETRLES